MLTQLLQGLNYLNDGRRLASQPAIRPFVWIPLAINVMLFSLATYHGIRWVIEVVQSLDFQYDFVSWLDWLEPIIAGLAGMFGGILIVAGVLLVLFVVGSMFTMMTHIVASPFLGLLAEKVEASLHTPAFREQTLAQLALRTLLRELRKLSYWLFRALGLALLTLVLWFIPGLNLLNPILWYGFGAWIMAMQYVDIAADNNGMSFPDLLALLRKHRLQALGFGGAVMLFTSIPVLNLFIVPVAVAGGVVFFVRHNANTPALDAGSPIR